MKFNVIPAIDIRNGKCVRLVQGDYAREKVYSDDPVDMAKHWADEGAKRIHLVDLDGAKEGSPVNIRIIEKIRLAVDVELELGGGIRSVLVVDKYLEIGIDFIILGSIAFTDEDYFKELAVTYPEKILLGIDAKEGEIRIKGWLEKSSISIYKTLEKFSALPLAGVILTDISRDGMMQGPNFKMIENVLEKSPFPVIASGGISSQEHIKRLVKLENKGCAGAIVGKALYENKMSLF